MEINLIFLGCSNHLCDCVGFIVTDTTCEGKIYHGKSLNDWVRDIIYFICMKKSCFFENFFHAYKIYYGMVIKDDIMLTYIFPVDFSTQANCERLQTHH